MKTRKKLENAARASILRAAEAIRMANEALNEASAAITTMEELGDDELAQVAGGGDPYVSNDSETGSFVVWEPH